MAKQVINIGTVANDGTGDPLRTAFDKVNDNFTELYNDDAGDVNSLVAGTGVSVSSATGDVTVTAIGNVNQRDSSLLQYWSGSQAQYDALTPDASTIYFIV